MRCMGWMVPMPGLLLLIGCSGDAAPVTIRNDAANTASLPSSPVPATTPDTSSLPEPSAKTLSTDVVAFRDRRGQCDHFRDEEPGDDARPAKLEKLLEKKCRGTDAELAAFRRRYRGDAAVIAALRDYEDQVE